MAKNAFTDWDTTASNNTDIGGIGTQGTNLVSNFDDAFRTLMAQLASGVDPKMVFTSRAVAYTPLKADNNKFDRYTAAATVALTAAATLTANWHYTFWADGADIVIDPNGAETINGNATLTLKNGQMAFVWCTGTAFFARVEDSSQTGVQNQGYLYGLTLANNSSDSTNDIDVAAGAAAADTAPYYVMNLSSAITKRVDAAWAVGTGNGGLDTGAVADVTYHVWLIQRSDTGVVDVLFSQSATAPTMPASYDRKRRIGSFTRNSSANLQFTQNGDEFLWMVPVQDVSVSNPGTAAVNRSLTVPSGIVVRAIIAIRLDLASAASPSSLLVTALSQTDTAPGASLYQMRVLNTQTNSTALEMRTDTARRIRTRLSFSDANTNMTLTTFGWIDTRGRT